MELIRITADKEKARSILRMVSLIEERIKIQDRKEMAALIIADYYEITKLACSHLPHPKALKNALHFWCARKARLFLAGGV